VAYFNANSADVVEQLLDQAVAEGADIIFTTTPQMIGPSLKASVKYPKVKILNCSVDMPYSTVRTYYSRIYEGKFITGAIAGALAKNDRIGYVGSYPIHGEPASINAFALGAQLTNPRAKIELKWTCLKGNPTQEFLKNGIRVISNRDTPIENKLIYEFGTYIYNEDGRQTALGSPVWVWGKFYEHVVRSVLSGSWEEKSGTAVNYWWGMSSGVIDVKLSDQIPEGVYRLAEMLRAGLRRGMIDPFCRKIVAQDGTVKNDGSRGLSPEEILHMDWLCENVHGTIPTLDEILPMSKPIVKLLGVHPEEREKAQ
jgi:basic membrane lipoprotein Med (substrate-binding protein (PBP1-ABC) superfamily)